MFHLFIIEGPARAPCVLRYAGLTSSPATQDERNCIQRERNGLLLSCSVARFRDLRELADRVDIVLARAAQALLPAATPEVGHGRGAVFSPMRRHDGSLPWPDGAAPGRARRRAWCSD